MSSPEPPPVRRRLDRLALSVVLLCTIVTLVAHFEWRTPEQMGALRPDNFWRGQYWRLLTTVLLHGGLVHLAVNSLSLYFLAAPVRAACGRGAMLLFLGAGAVAGLAASLLWESENYFRVGISGGVVSLLGLLIALEWAFSRSVRGFLRSRNTIVILFIVALNAGLAVYIERHYGASVRLDHAAHIGGLAFGLLAGLATYTRRGLRPLRGAIAFLLLAVLPIAYAAHPFRNPDYLVLQATIAEGAGDLGAAEDAYAQLWKIRPGHPIAAARLALRRDDPGYLEGLSAPVGREECYGRLDALLSLALSRATSAPERAQELLERTREIPLGPPQAWIAFAAEATARGAPSLAVRAQEIALTRLAETESWPVAAALLDPLLSRASQPGLEGEERRRHARTALGVAQRAAAGLGSGARLDRADHARLEERLRDAGLLLETLAATAPPAEDLLEGLSALWSRLADNSESDAIGAYRLRAARSLEEALGGGERVEALFRGAYLDGRDCGDGAVEAAARDWLLAHGVPLPHGELAGEERPG